MLRVLLTTIAMSVASIAALAGPVEDKALQDAAYALDPAAVKAALRTGANPNAHTTTARRMTPLSLLTMGLLTYRGTGNRNDLALEVAQALFSAGARLGPYDHGILFFPVSEEHLPLISLFLSKGASPTAKLEGYTPPELALKYGKRAAYELLVSRGGTPVDEAVSALLTLVAAAEKRDVLQMEEAIKSGANVNGRNAVGVTPLIAALRYPIIDASSSVAILWLLDNGADPNLVGSSGFSGLEGIPLHIFTFMNADTMRGLKGRPETRWLAETTMRHLLKAGAKVSGMDSRNRTALHFAAQVDNLRAAEILIAEGARVMARDKEGRTPLDYAESGPMIKLLKANGAVDQ